MSRAALRLVAERAPRGVTMASVAAEVGAPTGSIYRGCRGRDELLAELWMDVVEAFQDEFVASLGAVSEPESAVEAAGHMVRWARAHPLGALKSYVQAGKPMLRVVDKFVAEIARAVVAPIVSNARREQRS